MPPGLRRSLAILATVLRAAAERAAEPGRLAHRRLQRAEQRAGVRGLAHERGEVEVALVDADLLEARAELPTSCQTSRERSR